HVRVVGRVWFAVVHIDMQSRGIEEAAPGRDARAGRQAQRVAIVRTPAPLWKPSQGLYQSIVCARCGSTRRICACGVLTGGAGPSTLRNTNRTYVLFDGRRCSDDGGT